MFPTEPRRKSHVALVISMFPSGEQEKSVNYLRGMPITVKLEKFEGPLDLLLELIEAQKLEISEISLAEVTDQYLTLVREMTGIPAESVADFLIVASKLLLIKSRMLLPSLALSPEEEEEIKDLEAALREYRRYKEAAKRLKLMIAQPCAIATRELWQGAAVGFVPPPNASGVMLRAAVLRIIEDLTKFLQPLDQKVVRRVMSVETKIKEILERIEKKATSTLRELTNPRTKLDIILAFLAILFLFRERLVNLTQKNTFGEIVVKLSKHNEASTA